MEFIRHDGGRSNYFKGTAGDCVVRALAIAQRVDYKQMYNYLRRLNCGLSCRNGTPKSTMMDAIKRMDWVDCKKGLGKVKIDEYDFDIHKTYLVLLNGHLTCVKGGALYDTWNCADKSNSNRLIKGLWSNR